MRLYFERHDGQAVTCDDFTQAMADANQFDVTQFRNRYSQAGTPCVKINENYDAYNQTYTLTLQQSCPPTPHQPKKLPFHIPLKTKLFIPSQSSDEFLIELKKTEESFVFENISSKPILSINRDFSAPIKLEFNPTEEELLFLFQYDDNAFNRWESIQQLATRYILQQEPPK
jgi:aminopeptidase N